LDAYVDFYARSINLDNMQNIVFFDIDATLTSTIDHYILKSQEKNEKIVKSLYKDWETITYHDYAELTHSCIALFASFLKQTNSKAVCISAWNYSPEPELYTKELSEAFEGISDFPQDWLLGYAGGGGGDRWRSAIKPFLDKYNFGVPHVALDDGGFEYSNQDNVVIIDGKLGFNYYDYLKALKILNLKVELEHD
jgi:hypothetical protein